MLLKYKQPHISISTFNSIEIPDFVVLTGVNGSGKSHLLEAIETGKVIIEGYESANIVRFNYENFRLENETPFNAQALFTERESAWQFFQKSIRNPSTQWKPKLPENDPTITEQLAKGKSFWNLPIDAIKTYRSAAKNFFKSKNLRQNHQAQGIFSLAQTVPYSIDQISHDDFLERYKPYNLKNDFLPSQLGKIFWDYYTKYKENKIREFENINDGKSFKVLSESEFIATHGDKPWVAVNKILEEFDSLKYRVNSPEGESILGSFQLQLMHIEKNGLAVNFSNLSSGEKILMALVASVYKSASDRNFPDIILLDEVDASLHPAMMKNMLNVISSVFINKGVKVFLVTHSPTTIALAPDESIYIVNRSGENRIEKKSKQEALEILTQGFATLDQGLKLYDQASKSKITLISEGNNIALLDMALKLHGINDIEVLQGLENMTGDKQLRTLFDFFSRVPHENKVVFVWDCDVPQTLSSTKNTFAIYLKKNTKNNLCTKGIENMFDESLLKGFVKRIEKYNGAIVEAFDESAKRDFEKFIIQRSDPKDFSNFIPFIEEIRKIKSPQ